MADAALDMTNDDESILDGGNTDWMEGLSDEVRNDPSMATIKDLNGLATSHISSQKMLGSRIPMPGKDDADGWTELYTKLGRPEAHDKYEIPEEAYHGLERDAEFEGGFLQKAFDAGLSNNQVGQLMDWYNSQVAETVNSVNIKPDDTRNTLRQEWGNATDQKIGFAQRAIGEFGGEEFATFLQENGLDNHPSMVRFASAIGEKLMEDSAPIGDGKTSMIATPVEAKQQIADIMINPEHPYHDNHVGKSGHNEAVAQMQKLYQLAYPEPSGS